MALVKGRHCSESCMELLNLEMVHHYQSQTRLPCAAAIEAIGKTYHACPLSLTLTLPPLLLQTPEHPSLLRTGFRVGRQLAECYTANRARTGEPLEVIKFICKEFWVAVFRKQVLGCSSIILACHPNPPGQSFHALAAVRRPHMTAQLLRDFGAGGQSADKPQRDICAEGSELSLAGKAVCGPGGP